MILPNKSMNMDGAARAGHSIAKFVLNTGSAFKRCWLLRHRQLSLR
jgi:hypothetical protein